VYEELAGQDEMSLEFRVTGLAGKAIALHRTPADEFEGGIQEQQSAIRLCLDDETAGVRQHKDLLGNFLKEKILVLLNLEEFKSYGRYLPPPRPTDFAKLLESRVGKGYRS
jgi:hypothetical protein